MTTEELRDSVAIVGLAGRFPGAPSLDLFWQNLSQGVESVRFFHDDELDRAVIDPGEAADPHYVKARATLDDVELFDAALFGFSPKEAELTDPQHRVFLECVWEALEHAGYNPARFPGQIGIYAGAGANTYMLFHLAASGQLIGSVPALRAFIHNKNDHLTMRAAYKLNLRGPAVTVQTACSTSLVAVSLACQSLLSYQVDLALAGGVTITVPQRTGYLYHERGIGSPDGHCRAFDARAQGTVGGNGAGVVVLKRFEDALNDGDTIYALIRGAAVNNDGALRAGYTAPNADSQTEVIALAQALAGVDPATISYIEAHGTGTPLGDPIEVQALTQAFRRATSRQQFCALGSVKTNIGHLDTAAGIAGLIKTVLALQHRQIPPSLHYTQPNPVIDFAQSPFYVNARLRDWPAGPTPRRAGVSAFGLGGTNAHVVLEEAPPRAPSGPARPLQLLVISGKSAAALEQATNRLAQALRENPGLPLADVAYTLHVGRQTLEHRRVLLASTTSAAAEDLAALVPERVFSRAQEPAYRPLTLMFPGQGAQYAGMAAELYAGEPVFRASVDTCAELLRPLLGQDIRALIFGPPAAPASEPALSLVETALAQPALFVVEYALAQLWLAWGLRPQSLIGHSVGEYVAATLAGVFALEDALRLVALRGRLIGSLPGGAMLAVPLPERVVLELLVGFPDLSLAAVNSLAQSVVAGPGAAIDALERQLVAEGVICKRLRTSHAFHSAMMEPILADFAAEVAQVTLHPPQIPLISNVTGTWLSAEQATDPHYWARHIRQPVRFADGVGELLQSPSAVLLEVGPGHALRTIVRWHPHKKPDQVMLASLPGGNAGQPAAPHADYATLLGAVGQLWLAGIELDWPAFYAGQYRHRLALPTYPFERRRYWVDLPERLAAGQALWSRAAGRADLADWAYVPSWRSSVRVAGPPPAPANWLVLADSSGLAAGLIERLAGAGQAVIDVRSGAQFARYGDDRYTIRPDSREDFAALLAALRAAGSFPQQIVSCWGVLPPDAAAETPPAVDPQTLSLLALAQALGGLAATAPLTITALTSHAQEVLGGDLLFPEQASVRGPLLVIPREYPNLRCRSIDVALAPAGSPPPQQLLDILARELLAQPPEPVVAYRAGQRWVQAFEPLHLPPSASPPALLRPRGVYLITGGLGGIGLTIADYLARAVQARLILLGRTGLPPRPSWPDWLAAHSPAEAQYRQIRQVEQLEACGAQVLVVQADVSDEAQLRAALATALATFGEVHGVIHAAGLAGGGVIQFKEPAEVARVLAPKVQGTRLLGQLFEGYALDFMALQSSLTSVVGRFGQVDYTAGNAFLDAFARTYQARTGIPTLVINWAAWAGVGMAARVEESAPLVPVAGPPLGHPLLEQRLSDAAGREVFQTRFTVEKHWVLDEHRILGNPVIPGVAYFEMVRAALGPRAQGRPVEFQDVFFVAPLRVPDGEYRDVQLVLEPHQAGYSFAIRSTTGPALTGSEPLRDFTIGKVRLAEPRPLARYDIAELRARCNGSALLLAEEQREEDLGPRWHTVQRVFIGHNEVLLELELPEAFADDFTAMQFHPALLDRAAGIAKNFLASDGHYLPLTYRSLTINAPLQPKIYSYARFREEESPDRETITFDIVLLNPAGEALVEIQRFTQKRVNDPAIEIRALAAAPASPPPPDDAAAPADQILPAQGAELFARILAARLIPQVIVSPRDLDLVLAQTDADVRDRILEAAPTPQAAGPRHPRPNLNTPYVAPTSELERSIAGVWEEVLGIERVGLHDNFFELGGDSLIAIQVIARLERLVQADIPPVAMFEGATVQALARLLSPAGEEPKPGFSERQSRGAERRSLQIERQRRT